MNANKMITRSCSDGQSIFNVLDDLKDEGLIPQTANFGDVKRYSYGDEKTNSRIVGYVTVRRNEMFSVFADYE